MQLVIQSKCGRLYHREASALIISSLSFLAKTTNILYPMHNLCHYVLSLLVFCAASEENKEYSYFSLVLRNNFFKTLKIRKII
jgi:hypothetical protein